MEKQIIEVTELSLLKLIMMSLAPRVKKDNRFPISQSTLYEEIGLSKHLTTGIKLKYLNDKDIKVVTGINGTYIEVWIDNDLFNNPIKVPKLLFDNKYKLNEKIPMLYFFYNFTDEFGNFTVNVQNLDHKQHKYYFGSKSGITSFHKIKELLCSGENIYELLEEKVPYNIGDNVIYSEVKDSFIYSQSVNDKFILSEEMKLETFMTDKYGKLKASASKRNILFTITRDELKEQFDKQLGKCYYTNEPLSVNLSKRGSTKAGFITSVDRVDNNLGYVKGNVVFCLNLANIMKSDLSVLEFKYYIKLIYDNYVEK